jgi:hypothetical protein
MDLARCIGIFIGFVGRCASGRPALAAAVPAPDEKELTREFMVCRRGRIEIAIDAGCAWEFETLGHSPLSSATCAFGRARGKSVTNVARPPLSLEVYDSPFSDGGADGPAMKPARLIFNSFNN